MALDKRPTTILQTYKLPALRYYAIFESLVQKSPDGSRFSSPQDLVELHEMGLVLVQLLLQLILLIHAIVIETCKIFGVSLTKPIRKQNFGQEASIFIEIAR